MLIKCGEFRSDQSHDSVCIMHCQLSGKFIDPLFTPRVHLSSHHQPHNLLGFGTSNYSFLQGLAKKRKARLLAHPRLHFFPNELSNRPS